MFKIRGHFIKQEPYFNNLMQLTFSTECGDLDIMVPQDDYQQYFVTDTEPQMGSYWILRLFQKNYADLGGVMLFRFGTAEQIAEAPAAPAPTEKIEEKPMAPVAIKKIEKSPAAEADAKSASASEELLPADTDEKDTAEDEMPAPNSDTESNEATDGEKAGEHEEESEEQPIKLTPVNKEASTTDTSLIDDYDPTKEFQNDDGDEEDDDDDFITDEVQNVDGFNWDFQEKQPDESADVVEAKTVGTGDDVAEKFAEHEAEKTASEQAAENDPTDLAGKWSEDAADNDDEWADDDEADSNEEDDDDSENLW
ncbi:hypothetical protein [Limosilactobacillus mucosae]|uniref:hypothetical protein n=1 Tax=Limosilactobacillus mucosae TaxID=97478 RepID=UPI0025A3D892|nr:hypothetical protein [Limosilactobacillus mucosae]MDM8220692.1 hypothetical protein [Limosilactobacillus mucosae]